MRPGKAVILGHSSLSNGWHILFVLSGFTVVAQEWWGFSLFGVAVCVLEGKERQFLAISFLEMWFPVGGQTSTLSRLRALSWYFVSCTLQNARLANFIRPVPGDNRKTSHEWTRSQLWRVLAKECCCSLVRVGQDC